MRKFFVAAVLVIAAQSSQVRAGDAGSFAGVSMFPSASNLSAGHGTTARTAFIHSRNNAAIPTRTQLQPVVGSVQRTSHFSNPFTHKSKYTSTTYNPVLGTFGTRKFHR